MPRHPRCWHEAMHTHPDASDARGARGPVLAHQSLLAFVATFTIRPRVTPVPLGWKSMRRRERKNQSLSQSEALNLKAPFGCPQPSSPWISRDGSLSHQKGQGGMSWQVQEIPQTRYSGQGESHLEGTQDLDHSCPPSSQGGDSFGTFRLFLPNTDTGGGQES